MTRLIRRHAGLIRNLYAAVSLLVVMVGVVVLSDYKYLSLFCFASAAVCWYLNMICQKQRTGNSHQVSHHQRVWV